MFRRLQSPRKSSFLARFALSLAALVKVDRPRQRKRKQRGFTLPVALLIVLVLALVSATLVTRSFNRSTQATGDRAKQAVSNQVDPAISRARAKLGYLFGTTTSERRPKIGGEPSDDLLTSVLLDGVTVGSITAGPLGTFSYTLPGAETPLNISTTAGALPVPAWSFPVDTDGNGVNDAVTAYAIVLAVRRNGVSVEDPTTSDVAKARQMIVRNLPLAGNANVACTNPNANRAVGTGDWFTTSDSSLIRKPVQVYAITVPLREPGISAANQAITAVQLQQDRQRVTLGKYGAWFRYDLEIFPGPPFRWNGATYSAGNTFIDGGNFASFLISAPPSCFFNPQENSGMTTALEFAIGSMRDNNYDGANNRIDLYNATGSDFVTANMSSANDSANGVRPFAALSSDPVVLFTQNRNVPRYAVTSLNPITVNDVLVQATSDRDPNWNTGQFSRIVNNGVVTKQGRIEILPRNANVIPPYVDDTYRADNRFGPKPNYGIASALPNGITSGAAIPATASELVSPGDTLFNDQFGGRIGLDGYWERRAIRDGLRVVVGQRLKLLKGHPANPDLPNIIDTDLNGTLSAAEVTSNIAAGGLSAAVDGYNNDAATSAPAGDRIPDILQQAVQSTAVYHYTRNNGTHPVACLNTLSDGTNNISGMVSGAQFEPPPVPSFANLATPLMRSLINLATMSGDGDDRNTATAALPMGALSQAQAQSLRDLLPNGAFNGVAGAFPAFQEAAGSATTHPNPVLTRHGDFSNLRLALELMDSGTGYNDLSPADQAFLHTAGCSVAMLATSALGPASPVSAGPDGVVGNQTTEPAILRALGRPNGVLPVIPLGSTTIVPPAPQPPYPPPLRVDRLFGSTAQIDSTAPSDRVREALAMLGPDRLPGTADDLVNFAGSDNVMDATPAGDSEELMVRAQSGPGNPYGQRFAAINMSGLADIDRVRLVLGQGYTLDPATFVGGLPARPNNAVLPNGHARIIYLSTTCKNGFTLEDPNDPVFRPIQDRWNALRVTTGLFPQVDAITGQAPICATPIPRSNRTNVNWNTVFANYGLTVTLGMPRGARVPNPNILNPIPFPLPPNVTFDGRNPIEAAADPTVTPAPLAGGLFGADQIPGTPDDLLGNNFASPTNVNVPRIRINGPDNVFATADDPYVLTSLFWDRQANSPINLAALQLAPTNIIPVDPGNSPNLAITDRNIYNGRERMVVRSMYMNLGVLRTTGIGGDFLFPRGPQAGFRSGIIYAAREDAVREDGIARPVGAATLPAVAGIQSIPVSTPNRANAVIDTPLRIYLTPYTGTDPALTQFFNGAGNPDRAAMGGISPKPVDTYPDPLRRPYAFHLFNGADLRRSDDEGQGLSFISDNPVYIMGDFNLHTQEEFTVAPPPGVNNGFYTSRTTLNPNFAKPNTDQWRSSFVLGDAVTLLSANFNPNFRPGSQPPSRAAMAIPGTEGALVSTGPAQTTTINVSMVSGLVPSRPGQAYGGLHNFPRFIQDWATLNISGSFIQLNFSTQATAPFDQDTWVVGFSTNEETTRVPTVPGETISYYQPPQRNWGYDVGLQFAPTNAVAQRLSTPTDAYSEFVRELPADDPYAMVLRCALNSQGIAPDPALDPAQCP